jgi:hypothetical protein
MLIRIFFEVFSPFLSKEIISKWKTSGIIASPSLLDEIRSLVVREDWFPDLHEVETETHGIPVS